MSCITLKKVVFNMSCITLMLLLSPLLLHSCILKIREVGTKSTISPHWHMLLAWEMIKPDDSLMSFKVVCAVLLVYVP